MFGRFRRRPAPAVLTAASWPVGYFDDEDMKDQEGHPGDWLFDRVILHVFQYIAGLAPLMTAVLADLDVWETRSSKETGTFYKRFKHMYRQRQEFRSVVAYRVQQVVGSAEAFGKIVKPQPDWLHVTNLHLETLDIGPGLYVEHGFSTIVNARRIGRNFWVNQNVTIGTGKGGIPSFGDDCSVRTGAVVVGGIVIGDRVTIGANAFVDFDVPDDSLVVSERARIIKTKSKPVQRQEGLSAD